MKRQGGNGVASAHRKADAVERIYERFESITEATAVRITKCSCLEQLEIEAILSFLDRLPKLAQKGLERFLGRTIFFRENAQAPLLQNGFLYRIRA
jgi:hypothetical protein